MTLEERVARLERIVERAHSEGRLVIEEPLTLDEAVEVSKEEEAEPEAEPVKKNEVAPD